MDQPTPEQLRAARDAPYIGKAKGLRSPHVTITADSTLRTWISCPPGTLAPIIPDDGQDHYVKLRILPAHGHQPAWQALAECMEHEEGAVKVGKNGIRMLASPRWDHDAFQGDPSEYVGRYQATKVNAPGKRQEMICYQPLRGT